MRDITGDGFARPKRKPRKYITLKYLKRIDACESARMRFQDLFGNRTTIAQVVKVLHQEGHGGWEGWLLAEADTSIVEAMLAEGANVNAGGGWALTWLMQSRYLLRCIARMEFLLKQGARIFRGNFYKQDARWLNNLRKRVTAESKIMKRSPAGGRRQGADLWASPSV